MLQQVWRWKRGFFGQFSGKCCSPSVFGGRVLVAILFFMETCAPLKPGVEDSDLERVLERMAERKVQVALSLPEGRSLPEDWVLFREICEIYRLDSEKALLLLDSRNPELANHLRESRKR